MYRVSAGIETRDPGYKHLIIQPHPTEKLSYSKATFESSYGTVASGWERKDNKIILSVKIPANSTATIILPVDQASKVSSDGKALAENTAFSSIKTDNKKLLIEAGSGNYTLEFPEE
jgi:alpha-L-rhamnosidase